MTVNDYGKIIVHKLEFPSYSSYDGKNPNFNNSSGQNKSKEQSVNFQDVLNSEMEKLEKKQK